MPPPTPPPEPAALEPSDGPGAALEADMGTVTDGEFFTALAATPPGVDEDGNAYDPETGVVDLRGRTPEFRDQMIADAHAALGLTPAEERDETRAAADLDPRDEGR